MRLALGAGRRQLAVHVLAESLVLAVVGGNLVGCCRRAVAGVRALVSRWCLWVRSRRLVLPDVGMNSHLCSSSRSGITLVVCVRSFGRLCVGDDRPRRIRTVCSPAATRVTMSLSARRAASALVVFEVALAIVLLVGAGLILRSFTRLANVDPGFSWADHVMTLRRRCTLRIDTVGNLLDRPSMRAPSLCGAAVFRACREVGTAAVTPLTGNNWTVPFERSDQPVPSGQRPPDVGWQRAASRGYFTSLRIPLLAGRLFDAIAIRLRIADSRHHQRRRRRQRFFRGWSPQSAARIKLGDRQAEIVGVVGNIRRASLTDAPRADLYFPFERVMSAVDDAVHPHHAAIRSQALPARVATAVRRLEPHAVLYETRTLSAHRRRVRGGDAAGDAAARRLRGDRAAARPRSASTASMSYRVRLRTARAGHASGARGELRPTSPGWC